jgi:ParB family chromosome partitioning protein
LTPAFDHQERFMAEEAARHAEHRPRLGRGLAALLGEAAQEVPAAGRAGPRKAPVAFLHPNPRNPRKDFNDVELDELAASIRERGVIQPVLVRPTANSADSFDIIAGERRWRAAQRAGLHDIPILVIDAGDREALEIAIVENVQRADLNALEEAAGYAQLAADYGYAHADIARIVGKSRSHVANTLRLIQLPEHTRALLSSGKISAGHARALLAVSDPDAVADRIVARGLTVRDVERLGERAGLSHRAAKPRKPIDPDTRALEESLALALGAKVTIRHSGGVGEIRLAFHDFDQLEDFCRRLRQPAR